MLVVPYYNKPSQEGLYNHFKTIAESVSLPVMLYNVPGRTAINMQADTVVKLSKIDNIVCIKEASGNLSQISNIICNTDSDFKLYSGDDANTLPILSVGGYGVVSVAGHIVGNEIKTMINEYLAGNVTLSASLHHKLMPIFEGMFITSNPVPVKAALKIKYLDVGSVRPPLVFANNDEIEKLKAIL
jgi:4-hydroxy-tetrahydrodipicolinate synthase